MYRANINSTIVIAIFLISLFSCKNGTSTGKGSITGSIHLNGEADHSGITVMLFAGDVIPSELLENQQILGFPQMLTHVFDHRRYTSLNQAFTNASGAFSFNGLQYGEYIIAYYMQGWGFNYIFNVKLSGYSISINNAVLYEEIIVPETISGLYTFSKGKTYRIRDNCTCLPNSEVTLECGTNVVLETQSTLNLHGEVDIVLFGEDMIRMTSASSIYTPESLVESAGNIKFASISAGLSLSRMVVSYLLEGIKITRDHAEISNSLFISNCQALQIVGVEGVKLSNNVFMRSNNIALEAIYGYNTNNLKVINNLFIENENSFKTEIGKNSMVMNNVFMCGVNEIQTLWESSAIVQNNTFKGSKNAIGNSGKSDITIQFNDISAETCIRTFRTTDWINNPTQGWTKANNNNLYGTQYAVYSGAPYHNGGEPMPLDFTNNYWGTSSNFEIATLIFDNNDNPPDPLPPNSSWGLINYIPFKTSRIASAGAKTGN